jgi:RNA-binding protein
MSAPLSNAELRELKSRAQRLDPSVRLGHEGASEAFYRALDEALKLHGLVKVKFSDFKEEKKTLVPEIAEKSGSQLVMRVGNVAVFYRRKPEAPAE